MGGGISSPRRGLGIPKDPAPLEIHRLCLHPLSIHGEPAEAVAGQS